jgi:murein tripeptide amidase MpaA
VPRYRVSIEGRDYDAMADLVRRHRIAVIRPTVRRLADGRLGVEALVEPETIGALEAAGYGVQRLEDADAAGRERQAEMRTARARGPVAVRAPGRYLDVSEVEAALATLAAPPYDGFTRLIELPHRTWEGRTCHALRIGHGDEPGRVGIYFLGGIHAREWGSPDILIRFASELCEAYRAKKGLTFGSKRFTATQLRSIVEREDLYVFPQANPDGRHHSMTVESSWRKNRRPGATTGSASGCVGVDLNRNYDFLWDFLRYFDSAAPIRNSTDPCDYDVYVGPGAASEPETRNVVWLLDQHPAVCYFVDVHSYGELILYNWGDDENQTRDPGMNFRNPAFDGKRGRADDTAYREYIAPADREIAVGLATKMRNAIEAVRGRVYTVEQSMSLYPTAGTSDDYVFSRHLVDPRLPKVYGFTIEWGSHANPTPFHPPYAEMAQIIEEITAALLEFCRHAAR